MSSYSARFDFNSPSDVNESPTVTLKDLLAELNIEYAGGKNGKEIRPNGLTNTLKFIEAISNQRTSSIVEKMSVRDVKLIKFLFCQNRDNRIHLFSYLASPRPGGKATFDFSTTGKNYFDNDGIELISKIIEIISNEIAPNLREEIDKHLMTCAKLLETLEIECDEVIGLNPIQNAYWDINFLNFAREGISAFKVESQEYLLRNKDLTDIFYIHLKSLEFRHFVTAMHQNISKMYSIGERITPFQSVKPASIPVVLRYDIALVSFPSICKQNKKFISSVVEKAVGQKVNSRKWDRIVESASLLLQVFLVKKYKQRSFDEKSLIARKANISLSNIIAALSTVVLVDNGDWQVSSYWQGQTSQGKNPLRHLKADPSFQFLNQEFFIPHGVLQYWSNFFEIISAGLKGCLPHYRELSKLRHAYLLKCVEIYSTPHFEYIIHNYRRFINHNRSLAFSQSRQAGTSKNLLPPLSGWASVLWSDWIGSDDEESGEEQPVCGV